MGGCLKLFFSAVIGVFVHFLQIMIGLVERRFVFADAVIFIVALINQRVRKVLLGDDVIWIIMRVFVADSISEFFRAFVVAVAQMSRYGTAAAFTYVG